MSGTDAARLLDLLGRLAGKALAAGKPEEFWPALSAELRGHFSCAKAALFQDAAARARRTAPAGGAGVLAAELSAQGKIVGVVELSGKDGGFAPEDADALELLRPHLAAYFVLFSAEEREDRMAVQMLQMEKLASIGGLVAGFSHEVRNPLSVITGYADMLLDEIKEPGAAANVGRIRNAAKRIESLVKNLLGFSRVSRSTMAAIDLRALIDDTLELTAMDSRWSGIKIVKDYAKDAPFMYGNTNTMMQVFLNLIVNAFQALAGAAGRGRLTVRVRAGAGGKELVAEVSDDGPGIPPEILTRIFEPFFTTKGKQGTGLGLHIVSGIVENNGGKIAVDSRVGKGTTFVLTFPAAPASRS